MFEIVRYSNEFKTQWDAFIKTSKNGTFLFMRNYMDYHNDRFSDCSFVFLKKNAIQAVIPANINGNTLYSHLGLTYGGLVTSYKTSTCDVLSIFELLAKMLNGMNITNVIYKPVPYIYHQLPAQEDLYALFTRNAKKIGCFISSAIFKNNRIGFVESRKSGIRKALKEDFTIRKSENFDPFIRLMNNNLKEKYGTHAVHTAAELERLQSLFPENIHLYTVEKSNELMAGTVLYCMPNIVHVQYLTASDEGKQTGAQDLLFDELINKIFVDIPVFDFGHSTEKMGYYLNESLIFQKEGFGGRGICYETYEFNT